MFSLVYLLSGIFFLRSGIQGTKPRSLALWAEDKSGKPIERSERVAWGFLGLLFLYLGGVRLFHSSMLLRPR